MADTAHTLRVVGNPGERGEEAGREEDYVQCAECYEKCAVNLQRQCITTESCAVTGCVQPLRTE